MEIERELTGNEDVLMMIKCDSNLTGRASPPPNDAVTARAQTVSAILEVVVVVVVVLPSQLHPGTYRQAARACVSWWIASQGSSGVHFKSRQKKKRNLC
jgi:hypothetical protein